MLKFMVNMVDITLHDCNNHMLISWQIYNYVMLASHAMIEERGVSFPRCDVKINLM